VLFLVSTVAELVAPLVLRSDLLRRIWLPVIIGFHVTVTVTMNIDFRLHTVLVIVLFWLIPALTPGPDRHGVHRSPDASTLAAHGRHTGPRPPTVQERA
jgi:hypothetical protein